ncbi:MAG: hypothetical protein Q4D89_05335 [Arachnia propionica]|uniref:hypothetical protein n=1 Tax=Arachnia propionica TaxID=1750 RepID=UPI002705A774|nr:hypothetical protein [Arachnia propionica]
MDELVTLATEAPSSASLARWLQGLSRAERTTHQATWLAHQRDIRTQLIEAGAQVRHMMLAASFGTRPEPLLSELGGKGLRSLVRDDAALDHIAAASAAQGRAWCEALIRLATHDEDTARQAWPLTSRVATAARLPLPTDRGSWLGRLRPPRAGQDRRLFDHIVAELATLTPAEHRSAVAALKKALTSRTHETWREPLHGWTAPLMLEIGGTPGQVARTSVGLAWSGTAARDHLVRALLTRDDAYIRAFIDAMLQAQLSTLPVPLLDPLIDALDLPIPNHPHYLEDWVQDHSRPRPGTRWVERFVAACQVPNLLVRLPEFQHSMQADVARMRSQEIVDDDALVIALLSVLERGDRRGPQRQAWQWLTGLGLTGTLIAHRDRAIDAARHTDSSVLRSVAEVLLASGALDQEQLTRLSLTFLPRKEREAKRRMLRALSHIGSPSPELIDAVRAVASDADPRTAVIAADLLSRWAGEEPAPEPPASPRGLWRDPVGRPPRPLPEFDTDALVVDADRWSTILATAQVWPQPVVAQERALAALVATAHARGAEALMEFAPAHETPDDAHAALLGQLGWDVGLQDRADLLAGLLHRRTAELGARLGRVPCMLSAPSHTRLRLSWEMLAQRVAQYREAGRAALPADVAVALGRLDRAAVPDDLSGYRLPIDGCGHGLDEVLTAWRDTPVTPAALTLLPPPEQPLHGSVSSIRSVPEVTGDEPGGLDLLGITSPWNSTFRPGRDEGPWEHALLPNHPSRGAAVQLRALEGTHTPQLLSFLALAEVAGSFGPVMGLATVVAAADATSPDREALAATLIDAWDEGRLHPDDLAAAWASPEREGWPFSVPKFAMLLRLIADNGGLALAWPSLAALTEEMAGQPKVPSIMASTLEALLGYLPEVPGPVALPNVAALAERGGKAKAPQMARRVVAELHRR